MTHENALEALLRMAEIIFLAGAKQLVSLANSSGGGGRGISNLVSLYAAIWSFELA